MVRLQEEKGEELIKSMGRGKLGTLLRGTSREAAVDSRV
jgi:hypothetical protein